MKRAQSIALCPYHTVCSLSKSKALYYQTKRPLDSLRRIPMTQGTGGPSELPSMLLGQLLPRGTLRC